MHPRDSEYHTTPYPTAVVPVPEAPRPQRTEQAGAEEDRTLSVGGGSGATQHLSDMAATAPGRAMFLPGALVAGRYRITRFIARGGMGEVHEAEDLELRVPVALKTIRAQIASDTRILDRFRREIQLARQVTHPNVCRIFDLGTHQAAVDGLTGPRRVLFLTMELLDGETLSARLKRDGRMSTEEALPLLRQMARALDAAHEAGIVHRDFKSNNVQLAPSKTGGFRAVVTDFGLACNSPDGSGGAPDPQDVGAFAGTPAYMAPEQVEGREVTAAADIYAFGVVMYEMLTGTLPFTGKTPQESARKRLYEAPASPRERVPGLDPIWERVILRCLARDPAERWPSAMAAVRGTASGEETQPLRRGAGTRHARLAGVLASLLLLLGAGTLYSLAAWRQMPAASAVVNKPVAGAAARRAVAVLGFRNLAGRSDADWLSTALAEMLDAELAAGEKLRLIPGESVARAKVEMGLGAPESFAGDTLLEIRKNLGADLVVLGSYLTVGGEGGGRLRLDLKVQETLTGETLCSVIETGTEADLFDLVSRAGTRLREGLGVGRLSVADAQALRASLLVDPRAARLYSEGLAKLRLFDVLGARDLLQAAVAAEPDHPLPHAALAEAWSSLGHDAQAKEEGRKAFELAEGLPRSERLLVEARWRQALGEWDRAIRIYQTLMEFFPDNLDFGLSLAEVQTLAGQGAAALETVEQLRKFPAPARDDPRLDILEARAAESLSEYGRQAEAADCAVGKGLASGARLLVAEAHLAGWWGMQSLGQASMALQGCQEAYEIFREAGDRGGMARALGGIGYVLWNQREMGVSTSPKLAEALRAYEEALDLSREIGDRRGEAKTLRGIGLVMLDQLEPAEAQAVFEEALRLFHEIGDRSGAAWAQSSVGYALVPQKKLQEARAAFGAARAAFAALGAENSVSHMMGWEALMLWKLDRLQETQALCEQLLARHRAADRSVLMINTLSELALLRELQGDLAGAKARREELVALERSLPDQGYLSEGLHRLAGVLMDLGDLDGALRAYAESEQVVGEKGKASAAAWRQVGEGLLAVDRGESQAALQRFEPAIGYFREKPDVSGLATGLFGMAQALEQAERLAEAHAALEETSVWMEKIPLANSDVPDPQRLRVELQHARLYLREGQAAKAESIARSLLEEARKRGWVLEAARVRSVLGWALLESGKHDSAREELEAALAVAQSSGLVVLELETRLFLGRVQLRSGQRGAGMARLEALEREAREKGFGAVAREAAKSRR